MDRYGRLAEVGLDHLIVSMGNDTDDTAYELVAEMVRQLEPVPAGRW